MFDICTLLHVSILYFVARLHFLFYDSFQAIFSSIPIFFSSVFSKTRLKYNIAPKVLRNIKTSDQISFSCCPGRGKLFSCLCKQSINIENQKMMAIAMIPINPRLMWNTKGTAIKSRIAKIIHPIIHL